MRSRGAFAVAVLFAATIAAAGRADPPVAKSDAPQQDSLHEQLWSLWHRVDQLKEDIRRSHARLGNLSIELDLGTGAAHARVRLDNKLSGMFRVESALVVLDGAVQLNTSAPATVSQSTVPVFDGPLGSGDHVVQAVVKLRGHGFGVFSYLDKYRFEVRGSHTFTALEGRTTQLRAVLFERGDATTPIDDRPAMRFLEKVTEGAGER